METKYARTIFRRYSLDAKKEESTGVLQNCQFDITPNFQAPGDGIYIQFNAKNEVVLYLDHCVTFAVFW